MNEISCFDVLGPVMIGPSSSHTAGAARISYIASKIAKNDIQSVTFFLHGSFAKTYKGHGTDKALLAGILGMNEKNDDIKNSFQLAKDKKLHFSFETIDLGDVHPNTVLIVIHNSKDEEIKIQGSSIGGGSIKINKINDLDLHFSGEKPTIILKHKDTPGVIAEVTSLLAKHQLNIAYMGVFRTSSTMASTIIELDETVDPSIKEEISSTIETIQDIFIF